MTAGVDKELVLRNTVEVVTEEELDDVLKKSNPSVYCGYETSGPVHIGHMVTATKLLDLQEAGFKVRVLFADVHTLLNRKGGEDWINDMLLYWTECFKGLGLKKAEYVRGSEFQFEKDYMTDVLELALKATMNRALRSMQEVARDIDNARVSQVIYPLMQAVDIKALKVDVAYGGIEQRKIHMLARETLPMIDCKKPVCLHTPLLCSLQGPDSKMSSSKPETIIAVDEEGKSIKKKIQSAYCPPETEGNPVLDICRLLLFPRKGSLKVRRPEKYGGDVEYGSYSEVEADYRGNKLHPADLKSMVASALDEVLEPVREHVRESGVYLPAQEENSA
ncbi:MAG: tyrosine--tRNA ligase [Candidatus Altiarchaeales archaeon]|nr:tyrosine--tRNA ligase [Candidatus Altiarchaeales archaeon]MBD3415850.1 tyrosine--tRNA ligase [Candidatus Altiarchaeales archaeon]